MVQGETDTPSAHRVYSITTSHLPNHHFHYTNNELISTERQLRIYRMNENKFNSKISEIYKYNIVNCLLERAFKICLSESNFRSSLDKLRNYFYRNSFPVHFTEKIINQKLTSLRNISQVTFDVPKKIMFISLPYISDLSNKNIRLELTKLLARFYPRIQFRLVFKNTISIHNFFPSQRPCSLWPLKLRSR